MGSEAWAIGLSRSRGVITLTEHYEGCASAATGRRSSKVSLGDAEMARLGRRLFEYQESILPEGERWEDLSEGDQGFWEDSALRVVWEWEQIRGQSHDKDAGPA